MPSIAASVVLLLLLFPPRADAFPNGAGACPPLMAAVGGPHLSPNAVSSTLEDAGFQLNMDGTPVQPDNEPSVVVDQTYLLTVTTSGSPFRGYLFRGAAENGAALDFLTASGTSSQLANVCNGPGMVGVTHVDASPKTTAAVLLTPTRAGTFVLDLTLVESNNASEGSVFRYTGYAFPIVEEGASVPAPVPVPIPVPVPQPVPVPLPQPIPVPVPQPVPVPIPQPVPQPLPQPVPIPAPINGIVPQPVPVPIPILPPPTTMMLNPPVGSCASSFFRERKLQRQAEPPGEEE